MALGIYLLNTFKIVDILLLWDNKRILSTVNPTVIHITCGLTPNRRVVILMAL